MCGGCGVLVAAQKQSVGWGGYEVQSLQTDAGRPTPYYPVVVVAGCVTQGTAAREKQALAGGWANGILW